MNETYTLVGSDPSWIVAFIPIPAVLISVFLRKARGQHGMRIWQGIAVCIYFFVASVEGIPMEWILAGACIGGSLCLLVFPSKVMSWPMRIGFAVLFALLAIPFFLLCRIRNDQLILNDSSATYRWLGSKHTVPRQGLSISSIRSKFFFNIRAYSSWTSLSGQKQSQGLGPHIIGFDIYWGPHGLIRGDDLALHFARWAGVVPTLLTKQGDHYSHTPLTGFKLSD